MAVKNTLLGGTDWNTPDARIKPTDLNDTFDAVVTQLSRIDRQQLEQNINILINAAAAGSALEPYDDMFLDIFSVAAGFDGTVDVGNTDATFDIDKYTNIVIGSPVLEDLIVTDDGNVGVSTNKRGVEITVGGSDRILTEVTQLATNGSTIAYVLDTSDNILAQATLVSDVAVFAFKLLANTTYKIATDKGGASYTARFGFQTFPISTANLTINRSTDGAGFNGSFVYCIDTMKTASVGAADKIVQTNAQAITADPIAHQIFSHIDVAGSGEVTYDISFDGGSTYDTDQPLNTRNITSKTGSSMIIKLNLNGTGTGNSAEAKDYASMLYY